MKIGEGALVFLLCEVLCPHKERISFSKTAKPHSCYLHPTEGHHPLGNFLTACPSLTCICGSSGPGHLVAHGQSETEVDKGVGGFWTGARVGTTLSGLGHTVSKLMQLQIPAGRKSLKVGVLGFFFFFFHVPIAASCPMEKKPHIDNNLPLVSDDTVS